VGHHFLKGWLVLKEKEKDYWAKRSKGNGGVIAMSSPRKAEDYYSIKNTTKKSRVRKKKRGERGGSTIVTFTEFKPARWGVFTTLPPTR